MTKKKALVFLDVSVDGDPYQRMTFQLFTDVVPKTAENFRALCTGEKGISNKTGKPLHYKGTFFHRIMKGNVAQGGDFLRQDGKYGESIYDGDFPGESSNMKHDGPGLLSMEIADRDERGSLFSVTFRANHHLDRKSVVFGKLVDGYEVLQKIENAGDEDGRPAVTVKIINSGELNRDKDKGNKLKMGMGVKDENNGEPKRKRKHKKSSRRRRKRRRYYYTSESETSIDSDTESSETDSDSDATSLSDSSSSSSDDKRKKRKRSKRDRHWRGKKKDKRRDKRRSRRDRKSKRKSKRTKPSDSESVDGSSSEDGVAAGELDGKPKISVEEQGTATINHREGGTADISEREEGDFPVETGVPQSNGNGLEMESERGAIRRSDVVDNPPSKSRSPSLSPRKASSKSMSISPRNDSKSPGIGLKHNGNRNSHHIYDRSRSNSLARSGSSPNPITSPPRSKAGRSISRSPPRRLPSQQSRSRSPTGSPPRRRVTRSPPRISSRKPFRSPSHSPVRPSRKSVSKCPIRYAHRSASRSSGRAPPRSPSPSPVKEPARTNCRSYSRSPVSLGRRARSPVSDHGRSSSRSASADVSPKRIRRGRGFSDRYSYARRYRSRSPDRSPVRPFSYGGRNDRDRYSSYRRSSPRRYRSPPRGRTPRYRSRTRSPSVSRSPIRYRNRSPSVSRSPIRYRNRRYSRSLSPIRSRSPVERYRGGSPRAAGKRGGSPPSRSRSRSVSASPPGSPKNIVKGTSRSPSGSLPRNAVLVSYGDGSPDSDRVGVPEVLFMLSTCFSSLLNLLCRQDCVLCCFLPYSFFACFLCVWNYGVGVFRNFVMKL